MVTVKVLLYLVLAGMLLLAYVRYLESTSIFFPSKQILATPRDAGLEYEDVYFSTIDKVKINGWLVKAVTAHPQYASTATLIFLHGNAGNIGDRVDKVAAFHKLGLNVFIIDYRGYGKSQGKPSEQGMYYDALAAWDYLRTRSDVNPSAIAVYGASLGGAAAVDLAMHRQVSCLILDSTFSSARDMAKVIVPFVPPFLLSIKMDSINKIGAIRIPKLFIHSPDDEVVPYELGRRLFKAASHPKEFLDISGTHNEGYFLSRDEFLDGIKQFLTRYNLI